MFSSINHPVAFLRAQVENRPTAKAVVCQSESLTFEALDTQSNQLANLFRKSGLLPGEAIGIFLKKNIRTIISMIAAWKAGLSYIPIDPEAPITRIRHMVKCCGIRFAIIDKEYAESLREITETMTCVHAEAGTDSKWPILFDQETDFEVEPVPEPAIAYTIFTSGTTGMPKGVTISHQNLCHFIQWCLEELDLSNDSRVLNIADFSFDQSVMDIAFMLGVGAELHLYAEHKDPITISGYIRKNRITVLSTVPTIFGLFFDERFGLKSDAFSTLEKAFIGGAACPVPYVQKFHQLMPQAEVYNMYGPTEVTVYCLFHRFSKEELTNGVKSVQLGIPLPNHDLLLIDEKGEPSESRGELVVFGPQVMLGYWGNDEKSDVAFYQFQGRNPGYRTGDIIEIKEGKHYFVGRQNETIKSGGYRIDLGEIEAALIGEKEVNQVAVVAQPDPLLENTIHTFIVKNQGADLDEQRVRDICDQSIPAYMQPHQIYFPDAMPLNSSGKIDKRQLATDFGLR